MQHRLGKQRSAHKSQLENSVGPGRWPIRPSRTSIVDAYCTAATRQNMRAKVTEPARACAASSQRSAYPRHRPPFSKVKLLIWISLHAHALESPAQRRCVFLHMPCSCDSSLWIKVRGAVLLSWFLPNPVFAWLLLPSAFVLESHPVVNKVEVADVKALVPSQNQVPGDRALLEFNLDAGVVRARRSCLLRPSAQASCVLWCRPSNFV
jgi:hypothetical protein